MNSPQTPAEPSRRGLLIGAAAAAALAGAGVAWWRGQGAAPAPAAAQPGAAAADNSASGGFWAQTFDTPAGQPLALASLRGKPLLVNFWATWCPPCIEELPLIDAFFKQQGANGMQVIGLAIDQPSAVRKFLEKMPLSFPVALAGFGGTELVKSLGNATGALPFSIVYGANGEPVHRKMGKLDRADLDVWGAVR